MAFQTTSAAATIAVALCVYKVVGYWNTLRSLGNAPGRRLVFSPIGLINDLLPRIPGIALGDNFPFVDKHTQFARLGQDVETMISVFPKTSALVMVADADIIKRLTSSRALFPKPVEIYSIMEIFGPSILTSEAENWRKYRKISAPSFSESNNKLVWNETMKLMDSLFGDVWGDKDQIVIDHAVELTLPLALFVLARAGFGEEMSWKDDEVAPPGHKMTFKEALHITVEEALPKLLLPEWALCLTKKWRRCRDGFAEMKQYLREYIHERQTSGTLSDRHDLFSAFLEANNRGNFNLEEHEIFGNIYIFLLAGHETTAHTMGFTLALLALYQDEQEKLYQHVVSLMPDGRVPTYGDMGKFTYVLAVMNETLRLFPPAPSIPKVASEDTQITTTKADGEQVSIPVPKGTMVGIQIVGLHYNPRYWDNPSEFRPERFLKPWNKDAFMAFSGGARSCIGRKFSETETVAALVRFVSEYKISIKEEPQFVNETFEERKSRILKATQNFTLAPARVPLVFTRRS